MQCKTCERPIKDGEPIFRFRYYVKPEKKDTPLGRISIRDGYGTALGIECKRCHVKKHKRSSWDHEQHIEDNWLRYGLIRIDRDKLDQRIQEIASDPFDEKWLTKRQCEACGREIWNDPTLRNQHRAYDLCSEQCRNKLRTINRRVKPRTATCEVCGEKFHPKRMDAKTCGPACRQRLRRAQAHVAAP